MATPKQIIATLLTAFTALVLILGYYHHDETLPSPAAVQQAQQTFTAQGSFDPVRQVWQRFSAAAEKAIETVNTEVNEADLSAACKRMGEVPTSISVAFSQYNITRLEAWLCNSTVAGLQNALDESEAINIEHLPADTLKYVEEHPVEVALYVVETVLMFTPGGLYVPLLRLLGFTRIGVKARTIAALLQSKIGARVPARGWFAHLISAAMGGYGRKVLNEWTRIFVKIASWLGFLSGRGGD